MALGSVATVYSYQCSSNTTESSWPSLRLSNVEVVNSAEDATKANTAFVEQFKLS